MKTDTNRKRAGLGAALMVAGGLLVLSALSLFLYNDFDDRRASEVASRVADALISEIEARAAETPSAAPDADYVTDTGGENGTLSRETTISMDGETYIGVLRVPALGLALPVTRDWSYEKLKKSPCRYSGSIEEDNIVIAAHNYKRHFGNIQTLSPGDVLTFTDAGGAEYVYAVAEIETLEATAVGEMTDGAYSLTLFTCTYGGAARIAVRCGKRASPVVFD
ncbi:MAG: sortase [Oscillospiraceae bacterium]|jgi:sortase A|nr:sortase [Oscillospiraceae bacterium]